MDKLEVLVIAATVSILAVRLYQKYAKKRKGNAGTGTKLKSGSTFPSAFKDDDYEPYSKK